MGDKILDRKCLVNLTVRELELTWRSIERFTRSAEYRKYTQLAKDDIVKLIEKIEVLLKKNKVLKVGVIIDKIRIQKRNLGTTKRI